MREKNTESLRKLLKELTVRIDIRFGNFCDENSIIPLADASTYDDFCDYETFILFCCRLRIACELVKHGNVNMTDRIKQDVSAIIKCAMSVKREEEATDSVSELAYDLILVAAYDYSDVVLPYLPNCEKHVFDPDTFFLSKSTFEYCVEKGYGELAYELYANLCRVSQDCIGSKAYIEVVCRVMLGMASVSMEEVSLIGDEHRAIFQGYTGDFSNSFYWLYACAKMTTDVTEARELFDTCYKIRQMNMGNENWFTVCAKYKAALCSLILSIGESSQSDIMTFIDEIESGKFDSADYDLRNEFECEALSYLIFYATMRFDIKLYDRYLTLLEKKREVVEYDSVPYMSCHMVKFMRGLYYIRRGESILAETEFKAALDALQVCDSGNLRLEFRFKVEILISYCIQNDYEKAIELFNELTDLYEKSPECETYEGNYLRIHHAILLLLNQNNVELDEEGILNLKSGLVALSEEALDADQECEYATELAACIVVCIYYMIQVESATRDELREYMRVLEHILAHNDIFNQHDDQRTIIYNCLLIISYTLKLPNTMKYVDEARNVIKEGRVRPEVVVDVLRYSAILCMDAGNKEEAGKFLMESMDYSTELWHKSIVCINDIRLAQAIKPIQDTFISNYCMLREFKDEIAYESVLRFKALPSLAGRERNNCLRRGGGDPVLMAQIRIKQDEVARKQSNAILTGAESDFSADVDELRKMENDFARRFPEVTKFTEITLEKVMAAIPDNSAVVEYVFTAISYNRTQFDDTPENEIAGFDVYITKKLNGKCMLSRVTISDGIGLLEKTSKFVGFLQMESSGEADDSQRVDADKLKKELYINLVRPILPYIDGVKTVYIAPDYDLLNLPFEILFDDELRMLEDEYEVVKIECARDFLFDNSDFTAVGGELIIGNPQYDVRTRSLFGHKGLVDKERSGSDTEEIMQLPYSEVEANKVAAYFKCRSLCGLAATKDAFLNVKDSKCIHISTHGVCDVEMENESMFSSCLLFAGAANSMKTGESLPTYGNGMVTADEVSRLDLRSTELVVLSSCFSGMSDASVGIGYHGMVGALSAAGAHYVVSHLWSASDIGTAILMDVFYYEYVIKGFTPPKALRMAKRYLRQVTVAELRKRGWFDVVKRDEMSEEYSEFLNWIKSQPDTSKPFRNPAFWGGFVCYRCN